MESCFTITYFNYSIWTDKNDLHFYQLSSNDIVIWTEQEIKKIGLIDKKINHNQKIFNIQNKLNLLVKIYSINKNIDEYTKLFILLVLEYYNYSENHYLFINDVNDIPYFIENKYDLPIIIELNLYETKSLIQ